MTAARARVHHVDNHDAADEIGAALTTRLPQVESLTVTDMGPVLSIHLGAGAVGVVVQTAPGHRGGLGQARATRPVTGGRSLSVTMPGAAATTAGTALVTGIAV